MFGEPCAFRWICGVAHRAEREVLLLPGGVAVADIGRTIGFQNTVWEAWRGQGVAEGTVASTAFCSTRRDRRWRSGDGVCLHKPTADTTMLFALVYTH
jgi:hypothetical protein